MINKQTIIKLDQWLAVGLAFFTFFMSALISRSVFERVPHLEDEIAYIYQARIFARGDVIIETPEPRRAYWQPFVVDYKPKDQETYNRFSKYTPGWSMLLAMGINLGQPWVINAFLSMLTVATIYRLGREIYGIDVGLIAAALTALSPMALLINATLMSHTASLFLFTLFLYFYWRLEWALRSRYKLYPLRWGILAGIAMGLLVINRPLSALSLSMPFIIWTILRILSAWWDWRNGEPDLYNDGHPLFNTVRPFFAIAIITIIISLVIPYYNGKATGDSAQNLYTLVWDYDQVGFGECCGRHGHTIVKGIRHQRFDLSLMAADLFGWALDTHTHNVSDTKTLTTVAPAKITPDIQRHLQIENGYFPLIGLGFFLLPLGLAIGFKRRWLRTWLAFGLLWLIVPLAMDADFLKGYPLKPDISGYPVENYRTIWIWLCFGAIWMSIPPFILVTRPKRPQTIRLVWTWLLLGVIVSLIGIYLGYWIGSQRYSTRYYYESLSAISLLSALPIVWLANFIKPLPKHIHRFAIWLCTIIIIGSTLFIILPQIIGDFPSFSDLIYGENTTSWYGLITITIMMILTTLISKPLSAIKNSQRFYVYSLFIVVMLWSLYGYSTPRIQALYRYNQISPEQVAAVENCRTTDRPALVIASGNLGEVRWRSYGSLMVVTGPYLDDDIIVAWDYAPGSSVRRQIINRFPDREIIDIQVYENDAWFVNEQCN